ncbi:MAG TPA: hypothetical protein VK815_06095, partial [Candidatus Acidoferrales bacterium]|nr:hypothetical protein [Candidatus Acidoferrales bacterium]
GHDDLFLIKLQGSMRGGLLGFGIMTMLTTTTAVVVMLLLAGTAPHEKHRNPQNNSQRNKLLPVHAANITAIANLANGILHPKPCNLCLPDADYRRRRATLEFEI